MYRMPASRNEAALRCSPARRSNSGGLALGRAANHSVNHTGDPFSRACTISLSLRTSSAECSPCAEQNSYTACGPSSWLLRTTSFFVCTPLPSSAGPRS